MSLTIAAILVSLLSVGAMSVYSVKLEGDQHTAQSMSLICDNCRRNLNEYLNSVEQSVDMVTRYVSETLSSVDLMNGGVIGMSGAEQEPRTDWDTERQNQLDTRLNAHMEMARTVFRSVANHTNGVITYYYRMNPEISRDVEGFLFSKIGSAQFSELQPTPIPKYDPDDIAHVGWYYLPLQRGRPSWIGPYYNDNLDIQMVSYVTPIYKAGTFIGVIGMDISYDTLVSQISELRIFQSGYVVLTQPDGTIVYHPEIPLGQNIGDIASTLQDAVERLRTETQSGTNPVSYRYQNVEKQMYFNTLSNEMRLLVVAPEREIRASTITLVRQIIVVSLFILILFSVLMAVMSRHITEPLIRLAAASQLLAEGNYTVELTYKGNDEVGVLTSAFQRLVEHLRIYINDLNSRAYQDALTGVKNKGAYNVSARMLNDVIRLAPPGKEPEFALVMLDCNDLKKINDQYGHDKGDFYLRTACELICRVFTHSPVFRMGGDEFAVILQKDDYQARHELLRLFDKYSHEVNARAAEPWEQTHIAKGMAEYSPKKDISVESVLQRADENMYADKKRSKALRLA